MISSESISVIRHSALYIEMMIQFITQRKIEKCFGYKYLFIWKLQNEKEVYFQSFHNEKSKVDTAKLSNFNLQNA